MFNHSGITIPGHPAGQTRCHTWRYWTIHSIKCSELRASYPEYFISKNKIELTADIDVDAILSEMKAKYKHENVNDIDGVKIDFAEEWVHLRKSNTEPIIRIYSESKSEEKAEQLAQKIISEIKVIAKI